MARKTAITKLVPLNSKGRTYLAAIFDICGVVTYRPERDGSVTRNLSLLDIPGGIAHLFESAFGGERIRNGWRVRGKASVHFAREIHYFAPTMKPQLELYVEGCRLVSAKKPVFANERWISPALSERDKIARGAIAIRLLELQKVPLSVSNESPFPLIFVQRDYTED